MADEELALKFRRVVVNPADGPRAVQKFIWTRVGNEILVDVGYFDLVDLNAAIKRKKGDPGDDVELNFFITSRFSITPEAAREALSTFEALVRNLEENGLLSPTKEDTEKQDASR